MALTIAILLIFVIGFWSYVLDGDKGRIPRVIVTLALAVLLAVYVWYWAIASVR